MTISPLTEEGVWCVGPDAFLMARLLLKLGDMDGALSFYRRVAEADATPYRSECLALSDALEPARTD